jgi:hypothetical protein
VATTKMSDGGRSRTRTTLQVGILVLGIAAALAWVWRGPPQMGPDEGVFRTVDALFTAVTAKDERSLEDCNRRLLGYRESGKLPSAAAAELDAIIQKARSGAWTAAAERLYDFMKGQRRDRADSSSSQERSRKPKQIAEATKKRKM